MRLSYSLIVSLIAAPLAVGASAPFVGGGPLPPAGTEIKVIGQMPSGGKLVIGTKTSGVFISNAAKTSWATQAFGLTGGDGQDVKTLLVRSNTEIWAGTKDGLFRSTDGGLNFSPVATSVFNTPDLKDVRAIVGHPAHPSHLYATTKGGFAYSLDSGNTWLINNNGLLTSSQRDTKNVAVLAGGASWLLATKVGLYTTSDIEAGPWTLAAAASAGQDIKVLVANADASVLFSQTKGGGTPPFDVQRCVRSLDNGVSWLAATLPSGQEIKDFGIAPHPTDPFNVVASDKNGNVFSSLNGGASWATLTAPAPGQEIKALARDNNAPSTMLYAGAKNGFYVSTNNGLSWTARNSGLVPPAAEGRHVLVSPLNSRHVYVGTKTGLWFTTLGAETVGTGWTELTAPISTLFNLDVRRIFIDWTNDPTGQTIFIAAKFDLFKTTNGGGAWSDSSNGIPLSSTSVDKDIKFILQDPATPTTLYASIKLTESSFVRGEIYRSTDEGANWTKISDDAVFTYAVGYEPDPKVLLRIGDELLVGTKQGLLRAHVTGTAPYTFVFSNTGMVPDNEGKVDIRAIAHEPVTNKLAVATKNGVFISSNNGASWSDASVNLPYESNGNREVETVCFDGNGLLWAGSKKSGPYYTSSTTPGVWMQYATGLSSATLEIRSIAVVPDSMDGYRLYVGTKAGTFARPAPTFPAGDVDGDTLVNVADLTALHNLLAGLIGGVIGNPDVDKNRIVNTADTDLLADHLVNGTLLP